jgi:hypothetical protein
MHILAGRWTPGILTILFVSVIQILSIEGAADARDCARADKIRCNAATSNSIDLKVSEGDENGVQYSLKTPNQYSQERRGDVIRVSNLEPNKDYSFDFVSTNSKSESEIYSVHCKTDEGPPKLINCPQVITEPIHVTYYGVELKMTYPFNHEHGNIIKSKLHIFLNGTTENISQKDFWMTPIQCTNHTFFMGKLKADTNYVAFIRAVNSKGFSDGPPIQFKTKSDEWIETYIVLAVFVAIVGFTMVIPCVAFLQHFQEERGICCAT